MRTRAVNMAGFTLLPVILAMSLIAAIAFLLNRDNGINAGMVAVQGDAARARYIAEAGLQAVNAITQGKSCTGYTNLNATAFGAGSFTATVTPASGTPVTLTAAATTAGGAAATLTRSNVAVYYGETPATLQAPDSTGTEASLNWTSPTSNYGASTILKVITANYSALIHFDLSGIPTGSRITGATLQLSKTNTTASPGSIVVYRVMKPWVEGTQSGAISTTGVTYNTSDGTTPWTTPGGDYDPAPMGSLTNIVQGWNSWDVTGLVQGWMAASYPNYGMILVPNGVVSANFDSSDSITNHPILLVTYLAPCAGPPPPPPPGTIVTLPATQDTWISQDTASSNFGGTTSLTVTNLALKRGRGLVKFNLSSIPAGTVLQSATLRLYVNSFTNPLNSILTVNRVTNNSMNAWTEGGATWKKSDASNNINWSAAWGGSYDSPAAASAALNSSFASGWVVWNVTALAQEWVDGVVTNYGAFVLIDTTSAVAFDSRENAANQPQLVLSW